MEITFDPHKNEINMAKHGLSMELAENLEWDTALIWVDARHEYDENRQSALALLGNRLYFVAFVDRADGRRVISLRKANNREKVFYVSVSEN